MNTNEGEVIDLPDYTDEHLESRWMKSDLAIDYDDDKDNIRDDYLQSDELNEFQSPKVSHLSKTKQKQYKIIFQTFKDVLAKNKHAVGDFKPFKVKLPTDPNISCYQKQRNMIYNESILATIQELKNNGVIVPSPGMSNKYVCNLNMVPKLDNMPSKSITKADKFINKHTPKSGDHKPPAYRLTIDYSTLNKSLLSCPVHALPDIQEIKEFTRGKIINTMDLTNAYFSIKIETQDIHKTNFYFQD